MHKIFVSLAAVLILAGVAYAAQDVEVIGSTGTAAVKIRVDSSGRLEVVSASGTTTVVGGPAADDAAASGNPVPVGGIYNTTLPTYTALDRTQLQVGSRGSLNVTLWGPDTAGGGVTVGNTVATGETTSQVGLRVLSKGYVYNGTTSDAQVSVANAINSTGTGITAVGMLAQCDETSPTATTENQFGNVTRNCATGALKVERDGDLFLNIVLAAPTTTVVKSGAGRFHKLCINKATATGVITIYDNTAASGTLIATITQPAALLSSGINCAEYDLAFGTGLTVVTSTAAQDITVTYR